MTKDSKKKANRERWPEIANLVDEFTEAFGEVKVEAIYEKDQLVAGKESKDEQRTNTRSDSRDARVASWGADRVSDYWRKRKMADS